MQAEELLLGERASSVTLNLLRPAEGVECTTMPLTEYSVVLRRVARCPCSPCRESASGGAHQACTVGGKQGRGVERPELQAPSPGVTHTQGGNGGVVRYEAVLEAQAASCLYPLQNPIAASIHGARARDDAPHLLSQELDERHPSCPNPRGPPPPAAAGEEDEDLVSILEHVVARLRSAAHRGRSGGDVASDVASRRAIREQEDGERKNRQQGAADHMRATGRHGKVQQRKAKTKGGGKRAGKSHASMERDPSNPRIQRPTPAVRAVRGPSSKVVQKDLGEGKRGDVVVPRGIPCLIIDKPCWR